MKTIFVTLPYYYTYRNFILSGLAEELSNYHRVIVAAHHDIVINERLRTLPNIEFITLEKDSFLQKIANKIFTIASYRLLRIQNTKTFQEKYLSETRGFYKIKRFFFLFPFSRSKKILHFLIFVINELSKLSTVKRQLKSYDPDLYISTVAHRPLEVSYLSIAKFLKIKSLTVINSWDVISTKGSFLIQTDYYFVWNNQNKEELINLVLAPLNRKSVIKVVGAPHFDKYIQYQKESINTNAPKDQVEKILYTTSPLFIFPNEILLLKELACYFQNQGKSPRKELTIRIHPQAFEDFKELQTWNYKNVLICFPSSKQSQTEDKAFFEESFFDSLSDQISSSSKVLNTASTITLDSLAFSKTVGNIIFDNISKPTHNTYHKSIIRLYDRDHYKPVISSGFVEQINSFEELIEFIERPSKSQNSDIKKYQDLFLPFLGKSQQRFIEEINNILNY